MTTIDTKEEIIKVCYTRIKELNLFDQKHKDRLLYEIKQIDIQMEYDYFYDLYIKQEKFEKNENNLFVCYLLGLVDDFDINKEPVMIQGEFPDIDTDFEADVCDYIRDEWAPKTFGEENVCAIGTYGTFGIKSSLIDVARVFGKDRQEVLNITTKIGLKDEDGKALVWDTAIEEYPALKEYCDNNPDVSDATQRLLNRNKSVGTHAGGLIISSKRIDDLVPFVKTSDNIVSAFGEGLSGTDLGPLGFVKIDTLRLKTLTQIAKICRLVQERHGLKSICALPDRPNWSNEDSYIMDAKAIALANTGAMKCIFQFDSDGIREMVKRGGVTCFNDLVAYSALWRPGPLTSSMDERFIERKRGREVYDLHPILLPILKDTYGIMIFQEQTLKILRSVGGIPDMHCEIVRKAISKKKVKIFKKYKEMFLKNGQKVLGWTLEQVDDLWNQIEAFAEYGFNRSVLAYTMIPYVGGVKQIKDFVPGDRVYCVDESGETVETTVVALHDHGYLEGYEVTFDDGYQITCSANHKFLTEKGQVPLKEIYKTRSSIMSTHYIRGKNAKKENGRVENFVQSKFSKQNRIQKSQNMLQNLQREGIRTKTGKIKICSSLQTKSIKSKRFISTSKRMRAMSTFGMEDFRRSLSCSLWGGIHSTVSKRRSFKKLRNLSSDKTRKYSSKDGETQFRQSCSREEKNIFRYGKKNFNTSRFINQKNRKFKKMERRESGKVFRMHKMHEQACEIVKNGDVVKNTIGVEFRKNSLCNHTEASGFCERQHLDRSGWVLPFFRTQEQFGKSIQTSKSTSQGQNVERRVYQKKECDAVEIKHGVFSFIDGCDEIRNMGLGSGHAEITNTRDLVHRKIVRIVPVGRCHMFDLEVANPTHNFILPNGIVTSNSHSVAYTLLSARLLYLKAHYPIEFFAGTLNCATDETKIKEYKREAESFGVKVMPVNINKSKMKFEIVDDTIYMGFSNIKGIGDEVGQKIVDNQPYDSFESFLTKFGTEMKVIKPLICLRLFEGEPIKLYGYYEYYKEALKKIESMNDRFNKGKEKALSEVQSMFEFHETEDLESLFETLIKFDEQQFWSFCENEPVMQQGTEALDFKSLWKIIKKYKKSSDDNKHKNESKSIIPFKDYDLNNLEDIDPKILTILSDVVQVAESQFYGFSWNHLIETSPDYSGNNTFSDFESDESAYVKMCEVQVVELPKKKTSKNNNSYYEIKMEDANSCVNGVTFWEEDYLRFSKDLEYWESDTRKGNFIKIRLKKPDPPFKNFTFDSPPKHLRKKEIPEKREDDTRLLVMSRPFVPIQKIEPKKNIEAIIL